MKLNAARLQVVKQFGNLTVYRRKGSLDERQFVVGIERNGELVLLEEFAFSADAKEWAENNKEKRKVYHGKNS